MHTNNRKSSTTIRLLRHGETDYPRGRYYNDVINDPPLNKLGSEQARLWVKKMREDRHPFSALYVSPSLRTEETALIATKELALSVNTIDGLQERSFGSWGGLTPKEVQAQFPNEWMAWKDDLIDYVPPGGESLSAFSKRVNETTVQLVTRHINRTILIVTHVGPIRALVAAALGIPFDHQQRLVIKNCSITEIEFTDRWPNLHSLSSLPE
ncbi:MAG: histidine phosphatase family protein [Nitrospiria bacterium]